MVVFDMLICDFGWKVLDFMLVDLDGVKVIMMEYMGDKGLLIVFICNYCFYVKVIVDCFVVDV